MNGEQVSEATPPPSGGVSTPSPTAVSPSPQFSPSPTTDPEVLDGTYKMMSCDLGSGNFLIGSVEIENTGNVDAAVTVSFTWLLGDESKIDGQDETYILPPGRHKLVFFREDVSLDTALNFQDHPGYWDSRTAKPRPGSTALDLAVSGGRRSIA